MSSSFPIELSCQCILAEPSATPQLNRELALGLRTEHLTDRANTNAAARIEARIDVVEPAGFDTLVYFKMGGTMMVRARIAPETRVSPGGTIVLYADMNRAHLIELASGYAILRQPAYAFGDLDKWIKRMFAAKTVQRAAIPFDRRTPQTRDGVGLEAGAMLVREWKGKLVRVVILEDVCLFALVARTRVAD